MGAKVYDGAVDIWGCGYVVCRCMPAQGSTLTGGTFRCILGEMFGKGPILMGESDLDQLDRIFKLCGSPNDSSWPKRKELPGCEGYQVKMDYTPDIARRFVQYVHPPFPDDDQANLEWNSTTTETVDLITKLLSLDPAQRLTAEDALDHVYFWTDPLPADPAL